MRGKFGFGRNWGASLALIAAWAAYAMALVIALGFLSPRSSVSSDDDEQDRLAVIRQLHHSAEDRERQEVEQSPGGEGTEGGSGRPDVGAEAAMGRSIARPTKKRYGVQGPPDNPDPHLARAADLRGAREFGMIGILSAPGNSAPSAPWGRDTSLGVDETSARGAMWGDEIGENFGPGGLGLTGLEQGGGGRGEGVGLGAIGTLGRGAGAGCVRCPSFGNGHSSAAPKLSIPAPSVNGRLAPEVIRRIVRQNHGRFRQCYQQESARRA